MPATPAQDLLAALLTRFERRRPIRAGSLIVTLYGDAVAPRGGSLWLGSLNTLMAPFGIGAGLVRTAMSRLVAEGWFERTRIGRNSYYRLSPVGAAEFAAAARRIYRADDGRWDGTLRIAILTAADPKRRQDGREALTREGFAQLAPNVLLRPLVPSEEASAPATPRDGAGPVDGDALLLTATADANGTAVRRLAEGCWDLRELATAYQRFLDEVEPFVRSGHSLDRLGDEAAFQLRILLIHEYRRIVLRDPHLPRELLATDWAGTRARQVCRLIYGATRAGCERWLDQHAVNEAGRLPPLDSSASRRFTAP